MAVFYNYIKGCGKDATVPKDQLASAKSKTYTTDSWSFLKWTDKLYYTKDPVEDFKYFENNPIISFNNQTYLIATDRDGDPYSTGRILTSEAREQYIYYDLSFKSFSDAIKYGTKNEVFVDQEKNFSTLQQTERGLHLTTRHFIIEDSNKGKYPVIHLHPYGDGEKIVISYPLEVNNLKVGTQGTSSSWMSLLPTGKNIEFGCKKMAVYGQCDLGSGDGGVSSLTIPLYSKSNTSAEIIAQRAIRVDQGYVKAPYFNATSDARAKENIRKADFSAISIVNSLPIYNFNYKNSEKSSIGVIAQEAAEFNIDNFSLVENIEATGENGDYMSIKESKLIYILWKAIQEQQEEIEKLKSQLRGGK